MTNGGPSDGLRAIMGVFGPLLEGALDLGRGPAVMWEMYREAYADLGLEAPKATIQDMNTFVGGLGRIVTAMRNLEAANPQDAFTSDMWAPPIGYGPAGQPVAVPSMLATFQVDITTAEGLVSRWSSVAYNTLFPVTVGQLQQEAITVVQAQLDQAAMEEGELSPTAGGQVTGISQMYVTAQGL